MQQTRERRRRLLRMLAGGALGGRGLTPLQAFYAYDISLAWNLAYNFNETSGTSVINSGSIASGNGLWSPASGPPVGALGQTGKLGANEAYSFNGVDSIVTGPTSTTINNATAFTYHWLVNITTAVSNGRFFSDNNVRLLQFGSTVSPFRISLSLLAATTPSSFTTSAGQGIAASTWTNMYLTYDDAGDRKGHLYLGTASGVAEATYSASVAAVGALTNGSGPLQIFNRTALDRPVGGLLDNFRFKASVLSLAEMTEHNRLIFLT